MIVTCVTVYVKKENVNDFIAETVKNHNSSIKEPENMRFDILQCADDPCKFILYEAYASEAGAAAHKTTSHYLSWKEKVANWMAKPREGIKYNVIAPTERKMWNSLGK